MPSDESVTRWLIQLQAGDRAAVRRLWECYFPRLVALAHEKIRGLPGAAADGEDVALSAFASFCRHAERGRFPDLLDRGGLWGLLLVITSRKAAHLWRDQHRQKRGGAMAGEGESRTGRARLEEILSREPTPAFAAEVADECRRLLRRLGDPELETVALLRMEGYTTNEIAEKLNRAPRSVRRKVQLIQDLWEKEVAQ
jgi:DNA-directed RNA polymerase specialized sigma24 family protein